MTLKDYDSIQLDIELLNKEDEYFIPHSIYAEDRITFLELFFLGNHLCFNDWRKFPEEKLLDLDYRMTTDKNSFPVYDKMPIPESYYSNENFSMQKEDKLDMIRIWLDGQLDKANIRIKGLSNFRGSDKKYRNPLLFNRIVIPYILSIYSKLNIQSPDIAKDFKKLPQDSTLMEKARLIPVVDSNKQKKLKSTNKGGRPRSKKVAKNLKKLWHQEYVLKEEKGYSNKKIIEILQKEFPFWKKTTIETYLKKQS